MPSDGKSSRCLWQGELKEKDCLLVFWAICWNRPRMAKEAFIQCRALLRQLVNFGVMVD
jgi:hypothetical protein